jgi:hypothetical protein
MFNLLRSSSALVRRRGSVLTAALAVCALGLALVAGSARAAGPPIVKSTRFSAVGPSSAILEATINPNGAKVAVYHFEYVEEAAFQETGFATATSTADGPVIPAGTEDQTFSAEVTELSPATLYRFRVIARNAKNPSQETIGPELTFYTLATPPVFGPCPNDAVRSGPYAPLRHPSAFLPDCRAYEQASPVDKDGGDAVGELGYVKAASTGNGISFGSTFGIPGGTGAQALPTYLATRGPGESGWSTQGLLPPPSFGERALLLGWLPDFSEAFNAAVKLGNPRTVALVGGPTNGGAPTQMTPYIAKAGYYYAGASADASSVLFESPNVIPHKEGTAIEGASNVYAYDKNSGELSLASVLNDGTSPPKGAFAGPYNWLKGISGITLGQGGSARSYYLREEHAISASGDVVFTAANSGQLYLRENPTAEQSPVNGSDQCEDAARACTLHVSAPQRSEPDPGGSQPAAFQAASSDGSKVFFTSPEKLTDDANTGPEPAKATIGIGGIEGGIENASFIPAHAVGLAADSEYVYWADPQAGAIGRAKLNGDEVIPAFISPPPGECETESDPENEPGVYEKVTVPSTPRYVAVDSEHIYWTNSGRRELNGDPRNGGGTIGRADIDGKVESIEPAFICGEDKTQVGKKTVTNPQGIAVNGTHIYWVNSSESSEFGSIGRAALSGGTVEGHFASVPNATHAYGLALSPTHLYYTTVDNLNDNGSIVRVPLAGGALEEPFVPGSLRGIAVDASHVYWATQANHAIGRADLELNNRESEFTSGIGGNLNGLVATATHLYWSVNGEVPINPGNDLYRYEPEGEALTDLTPDSADENGAEVQGVLGTAADGSRVYFAANGDLDSGGPAEAEDCRTITPHASMATLAGTCNLYLWEEDSGTRLVALIDGRDARDWAATPLGVFNAPKTSFVSEDGATLLFSSKKKLSAYDNEGTSELYRFQVGDPVIRCVSCQPAGEAPNEGPKLGSIKYPNILSPAEGAAFSSRNLSADGTRAFFESDEALVPGDVNGRSGCPPAVRPQLDWRACRDVYEWVSPGTEECEEGGPGYNPLNGGCLYLISTGKSKYPSLFADASETGEDVFFFTRDRLVGQDEDELQDVYDARVGGGLTSQNPLPTKACEGEGCKPGALAPPAFEAPPQVSGPPNPRPPHCKKGQVVRKGHCVNKPHHKQHHRKKRAHSKRRAHR